MRIRRKLFGPVGLLSLSLLAIVASVSNGFQDGAQDAPAADAAAAPSGLTGILPDAVPDDLSPDAFEDLTGDLEELGISTAEIVAELYEGEATDAKTHRELIGKLRGKIAELSNAAGNTSDSTLRTTLRRLQRRLARRVDLAEAALNVVENPGSSADAKSGAANGVRTAIVSLGDDLRSIPNGNLWLDYLKTSEISSALDSDGAEALLKAAQQKLNGAGTDNTDQTSFLGRPSFRKLASAIDVYLTVASGDQADAVRRNLATLLQAVEEFESDSQSDQAAAVRNAYSALKLQSSAAQSLGSTLRAQQFNYNLHASVSESFLSRFVSESRSESGGISDYVLGARISGCQFTDTSVDIDFQPSAGPARMVVTVSGHVRTNTTGVKHPATVYTSGNHTFHATKPVSFDGYRFSPGRADITVNANNYTRSAKTTLSWIPLLGDIADDIALQTARGKRPQSEAITARKIADKALPQLNQEADTMFAKVNGELDRSIYGPLSGTSLYPTSMSVRSSSSHLAISSRTMGEGKLGGSVPPAIAMPSGAAVQIHESLVNNFIDELKLNGMEATESQLISHLESVLSDLLDRDIRFGDDEGDGVPPKPDAYEENPNEEKKEGGEDVFLFDENDPIRVQFEDNSIIVVVRAGIRPAEGDEIPLQIIRVPIRFTLEGSKLVFEADDARVTPVERVNRAQQLPRQVQIRRILKAKLPRREFDTSFEVKLEGRETARLSVQSISSTDGWMTAYIN